MVEFVIRINSMDNKKIGKDGCYLTVTGTSAENGDDGAVGRGNRINGLITPNRVMSLEATAGKNPISHVGKIYNALAFSIANEIFNKLNIENSIKILGRIGSPIDEPEVVNVDTYKNISKEEKKKIKEIVNTQLKDIDKISKDFISGKIKVC